MPSQTTIESKAVRESFLPFAQPDFGPAEFDAVRAVLESGWITTAARTKEFEREFAAVVGAKHAIAVNSCTAALHLALEAVGVKEGDEVITTPYTFAASAEVIRYFNALPVFVDVDPRTFNIDPAQIERAITPKTKAIIPVHIAGLAADLDPILALARPRGIAVIEDAAHSFPATYKGRTIGTIGDLTCFSFYATKTLATAEGGMICTDNEEWAKRCRVMATHGIDRDAFNRYASDGSWYYEVVAPGFKYNLTDIASALGLEQLKKAERMARRRNEIAMQYTAAFGQVRELETPIAGSPGMQHAWHLYMLRLNLDMLTIDRHAFWQELKDRKIGASVHFIPLHIQPYYRDLRNYQPTDFPVAHREYLRELSLPIYSKMTDDDVRSVIDAVTDVVSRHTRA